MSGFVYLVGGGPGDPGLITLRGIECLKQADVVVHDRLVNHCFLAYAPQAEWIDVGKQPDNHPVPQSQINAILVKYALDGKIVVRLKGGDPFVFGRGGEEALELMKAGIPFEIVPGVTSAIAGPAYAGIPVTHRGVACSVTFITGHRVDCSDDPGHEWRRAAQGADTLVFLMGVQNLPQIVAQMLDAGRSPHTPVALVEQATVPGQKVVTGTLETILSCAAGIRPPAITIVGEVVGLRDSLCWFDHPDRRPLLGLRILNTRPVVERGDLCEAHPGMSWMFNSADEFSRALLALGAEPVYLPMTRIVPACDSRPLDAAIRSMAGRFESFDWVVFTSANAVHFFWDRLCKLGYDARVFGSTRIAAVGPATAEALRPCGLQADWMPTHFAARELEAGLGDVSGLKVLLPRSGSASNDFSEKLESRGARVHAVTAYDLLPGGGNTGSFPGLKAGRIDVLAFFSPSAVEGFVTLLEDEDLYELFRGAAVACIGPTTAEAAARLGLQVDLVPEEHTLDGLCSALVAWRQAVLKGAAKE